MGTDIHMTGEKYDTWAKTYKAFPVPDKFTDRYYSFFAAIGNVRNGYGFAGCYRHEEVVPISDNRGIPTDAAEYTRSIYNDDINNESTLMLDWIGDHSFSYVTLKELKEYDWPIVIHGGVMPYNAYLEWDKVSIPEEYSGGVAGNDIITINESDVNSTNFLDDKRYYVQFTFNAPLVDPEFIKEFINYLELFKGWKNTDNDIRIVFGFDS